MPAPSPSSEATASEPTVGGSAVGGSAVAEPPRLTHVAALDGLRGLAVIAVLVYHQGANTDVGATVGWAHGGFLGVDLFFVLSGFLITSLLLVDHERRGHVVSVDFWIRRARRLLPALFIFLAMVAAYGGVFARSDVKRLWHGLAATLFYVANYWQLGDARATQNLPIGHVWSLSIEEQFYLVWPVLLALLLVATRGRMRVLAAVVGVLALASAALMAVQYNAAHPFDVYLPTQTRVFALLIGAVLAFLLRGRGALRRHGSAIVVEAAGFVALAFLVGMVLTVSFTDDWLYRGGLLLVALAAAVCIGAAVQPTSSRLAPLLSWRPLCAVGLVSYGLYLYSLPVFYAIGPEHVGLRGYPLLAVRLLVLGAIATLSFVFVERPIRRNTFRIPRLRYAIPTAIAAIAATAAVLVIGADRQASVPSPVVPIATYQAQALGAPRGAVKVLVAGDGLAFDLAANTNGPFSGFGIYGTTVSAYGCGLTPDPTLYKFAIFPPPYCSSLAASTRHAVKGFQPDVAVLMAGPSEVFDRVVDGQNVRFGTPAFERFLDAQLDKYRVMLHTPNAPLVLLTVPCMRPVAGQGTNDVTSVEGDPSRVPWLNQVWNRYAARHAGTVKLVDLAAFLCPPGSTQASITKLRPDGVNLDRAGAAATWKWLAPIVVGIAQQH